MSQPARAAEPPKLTAMVAGGSGLVGGQLLKRLVVQPDFGRVLAITRRPLSFDHPRLANRIVRFESLEQSLTGMRANIAFCCLGTTMRAAGSREAFRRIDHDCVLAYARAARAAGVARFVVVSSIGADSSSKNFYLRVKGETEAALAAINFPALDIVQPGLLLGWRDNDLRPLDLIAGALLAIVNPLLLGPAEPFRAISASVVAAGMIGATRTGRKGIYRYTHRDIRRLAG